jgi:hypothetical protein
MRRTVIGLCLTALIAFASDPGPGATAEVPRHLTDSLYRLVAAPSAAFVWFPTFPHVRERVTLVSTSTDLASPIMAYAWDLADVGGFGDAGQTVSTSFSTPASHVVRMQVTARDGRSSVAAETIDMSPPGAGVMNPFPTVRIVGIDFPYGTKIRLLAVRAQPHSLITVECRGKGCAVKSLRRAVPASTRGLPSITFRRFERLLRPGANLRIRVSRGTEIGAYTHFTVRRRRIPLRVDSCLSPAGITPILCPS